jgi:hypothetical protein
VILEAGRKHEGRGGCPGLRFSAAKLAAETPQVAAV